MQWTRARAAALVAASLVAAVAGCGDDGGPDCAAGAGDDGAARAQGCGGDPTAGTFDLRAVRALPDQVADAETFSFEMTTAYLLGGDDELEVTYAGSVDVGAHRAALEADLTDFVAEVLFPMSQIGGGSGDTESPPAEVIVPIVVDGDVGYAELGVINDLAPEGERQPPGPRWVRFGPEDLRGEGSTFARIVSTADPEAILALLGAASGEVETVGEEDVRGEPATHVRATIDLATAREQAPEDQWAMIDDLAGEGDARLDEVPVDLWVGEDGLLRRFTVEVERDTTVSTESPGGPPRPSGAAGSVGSLTYEAFDYGEPVEIEIPAAGDVTDAPG